MKKMIFGLGIFMLAQQMLFAQEWTSYTKEGNGLISDNIRAVCVDMNGLKWFGSDSGLICFDGSAWHTFRKTEDTYTLADDDINDIAFELTSHGSELWIATNNGVTVVNIDDIDALSYATPYRTDNTALPSNVVRVAVVDSSHNRWFGTDSGLSRFQGSDWTTYTETTIPEIVDNDILSIGYEPITEADSIWTYIGTNGDGVSRLYSKGVDAISAASSYIQPWSGLPAMNIKVIYVDSSGVQWYGTYNGLAKHDTTAAKELWTTYNTGNGLVNNTIQAIAVDPEGMKWIGTHGGVSAFDGSNFYNFTTGNGLISNNVRDIAVDLDGSIWFGTDQGISHYTGDPTAVDDRIVQSVADFKLLRNYPNPFNPITTIEYRVEQSSNVVLSIFNLNGQEIQNLTIGRKQAGLHTVQWNGQNDRGAMVPSGVYVARLTTISQNVQQIESIKMVLVK